MMNRKVKALLFALWGVVSFCLSGCSAVLAGVGLAFVAVLAAVFATGLVLSSLALEYVVWSLVRKRLMSVVLVMTIGTGCGLGICGIGIGLWGELPMAVALPTFIIGFGGPAFATALIFLIIEIATETRRAIAQKKAAAEKSGPPAFGVG